MKQWRFVFTGARDAFFNMALDEAILRSCQTGQASPTLRLYLWRPPGVSIGYFQSLEKMVDLNKCKKNNIDVVRRITGGRAVLHENEITYSVCASLEEYPEFGENINETYQKISFALLESLKALKIFGEWVKPNREGIGIDSAGSINSLKASSLQVTEDSYFSKPCFMSNSRYEITVEGKKLIGSAQRRFQDSFIQHGSIPLGNGKFNLADLLSIESLASENTKKRVVKKKLEEKSTSLEKLLKRKVEYEEVISAFKKGFSKFFDVEMVEKELTQKEIETAQVLKQKKYSTEEWNFRKRYLPIQEDRTLIFENSRT
jgi:lipoate-protein ligase A